MDKKTLDKIKAHCAAIPGGYGWWKDGSESYVDAATEMVKAGMPVDGVLEILSQLYWAAAAEFGG